MRIFRTLLIAAVNAIKEFLAFATDNGASQVGDTIKLNDGMATSNYDWSAYPSDTTVIGNYTATGTVEKIKEVNGETVYVTQEPEQDNKDVKIKASQMYYAYTNENDSDDSVYTTDDPISKGAFILENATNNGCTIDSDMAYGSSNNKIIVNNISNLNTYNSWSFNTKFVYNGGGGGTYGQQVLGVGSGHGIRLGTLSNNRLFCCLSSADGSWTIAGDGTYLNKTLTVGNTYYLQFGYDGTQYYCKCEETPITQETNTIWTLTSPLKVNTSGGLWLLNYHYSPSAEWFAGPIYLDETNFVLDGVVTTFGYFTNPSILYDDTFTALNPQPEFTVGINSITVTSETPNITYNRNSDNDEIKQITSNIEIIDNTTINSVTISTPTQGVSYVPYYAYTYNGTTYYTRDSVPTNNSTLYNSNFENLGITPSYVGSENLINNATVVGSLNNNIGVYSGFSTSSYINLGRTYKSTNNAVYRFRFTPRTSTNTGQQIVNCAMLFNLDIDTSNRLYTWSFAESQEKGGAQLQVDTAYDARITINGSSKTVEYKLASDDNYTTLWSGTDSSMSTSYNYDIIFGMHSSLTDSIFVFSGDIDMNYTYFTINGVDIKFCGDDYILVVNNNKYERNSSSDLYQEVPAGEAVIDTSANVTTANNGITDTNGLRHSFNITVPATKVAYIESSGISYQASDMPIDVYNGRGVGIAIKDSANSQTSYYINSWVVNKNYDLHYQQITFTTNVENPTIIFKINNNVIESPYYGYCGDNYTYTISKKGYEDYNGSGKISYSSKDGNIINIEANLTPSSNSIDVTGWTYSVDNGVVTLLDGPVDASGELTFPNIEEE